MTRLLIGGPEDGRATDFEGPVVMARIVKTVNKRFHDVVLYRYRSYKLRSGNRTYEILVGEDVADDEVFDYMIKNYRPVAKYSVEEQE